MGLAHEKKSYLQEKANLFEIGSYDSEILICNRNFPCYLPLIDRKMLPVLSENRLAFLHMTIKKSGDYLNIWIFYWLAF